MFTILIIIQVCLALSVIGLVLIQHGKGADMGAAFGSGASATVFGASGSGSFLTRITAVLAALFFLNSLLLATPLVNIGSGNGGSVAERLEVVQPASDAASGERAETADPVPAATDVPEAPDVPAPPGDVPG